MFELEASQVADPPSHLFQSLSGLTLCLNNFRAFMSGYNAENVSIPFRADTVFEHLPADIREIVKEDVSIPFRADTVFERQPDDLLRRIQWSFNPFQG